MYLQFYCSLKSSSVKVTLTCRDIYNPVLYYAKDTVGKTRRLPETIEPSLLKPQQTLTAELSPHVVHTYPRPSPQEDSGLLSWWKHWDSTWFSFLTQGFRTQPLTHCNISQLLTAWESWHQCHSQHSMWKGNRRTTVRTIFSENRMNGVKTRLNSN